MTTTQLPLRGRVLRFLTVDTLTATLRLVLPVVGRRAGSRVRLLGLGDALDSTSLLAEAVSIPARCPATAVVRDCLLKVVQPGKRRGAALPSPRKGSTQIYAFS
jgi:hypothetical protein